jgi:hypothetical protein
LGILIQRPAKERFRLVDIARLRCAYPGIGECCFRCAVKGVVERLLELDLSLDQPIGPAQKRTIGIMRAGVLWVQLYSLLEMFVGQFRSAQARLQQRIEPVRGRKIRILLQRTL